jgi:small-conductance mechanosensitive channel
MQMTVFSCSVLSQGRIALTALLILACSVQVAFAQPAEEENAFPFRKVDMAPVIIDGKVLFKLRGVSAFPASIRASEVRSEIVKLAMDKSFSVEDLSVVEGPAGTSEIHAGNAILMHVITEDARAEGIERSLLARVFLLKIKESITQYREDRSSRNLLQNTGFALGITLITAVVLWLFIKLFHRVNRWVIRRVHKNVRTLEDKSHNIINAASVWSLIASMLRAVRFLAVLIIAYLYLNTVLGLYPWTRPTAMALFNLVLDPLEQLGQGIIASIPNLIFLTLLFILVRYLIRVIRAFFDGIAGGRIKLENFEADWADPTFKILRILILAFAVVVAYPYIPGSNSMAFKGVSLFLGVIFSLGSSSFISNMIAGLTMTYRGAFKEGDRVRIGDVFGTVERVKLMVTRIRTPKNETVIVPNSNIINNNVINYSLLAREEGLILHTTVGIGYDTPWRQVEAMLKIAAERTSGLKMNPPPFVLQNALGDFAVNYQLNAYCGDAARIQNIYSELHANIQDVFNEHGVQIMSPAYENDPAQPKVVPPEDWYTEPALKPGDANG